MRPASVPLWCMLVALASSLHIGEYGGVVPLGEGGPGGSYIPGLHSKARTAREARARNVRVETEAQGERIKAYDQTGSSANSITAPAPLDPWGKEATSWRDAVDTAADTGTPLSKAAKAAATNVAAKRLNKKMKASEATRTSKPIVPVVVNVVAAPDQNNEEAAQGSVSRGDGGLSPVAELGLSPKQAVLTAVFVAAIAGNDARKFTKLVAQMDGDRQEVGDSKAASVNSGPTTAACSCCAHLPSDHSGRVLQPKLKRQNCVLRCEAPLICKRRTRKTKRLSLRGPKRWKKRRLLRRPSS